MEVALSLLLNLVHHPLAAAPFAAPGAIFGAFFGTLAALNVPQSISPELLGLQC